MYGRQSRREMLYFIPITFGSGIAVSVYQIQSAMLVRRKVTLDSEPFRLVANFRLFCTETTTDGHVLHAARASCRAVRPNLPLFARKK